MQLITNNLISWLANDTPGPGHYRLKSDFETNQYIKAMDDKGTYLTIENGHLNQKK